MKNLCGHHVAFLRHRRAWSQEDLQQKLLSVSLRMSRSVVAKIELGLRSVSDFELLAFAAVFKVPVSRLLRDVPGRRQKR